MLVRFGVYVYHDMFSLVRLIFFFVLWTEVNSSEWLLCSLQVIWLHQTMFYASLLSVKLREDAHL